MNDIRIIPSLVAIAITLILWFTPTPEGLDANAWHLLALFVGTIVAIIGKAMPIGVISIIAITIVAITKVTSPDGAQAIKDSLSGFSHHLIWLIGAAILLSKSLSKTNLGERIGYTFISLFGKKTIGIGYALSFSELMIAPVTPSNTARCGGIIHPIMKSIASSFNSSPAEGTSGKIGRYLALVNYQSNPITSAMFITATAPNPLVVDLIIKNINDPTIEITWISWAIAAFLPGMIALLCMPIIIYFLAKPEITETPGAPSLAKGKLKEIGPMSKNEIITAGVFVFLLVFWAGIPKMIFGDAFNLHPTTVAFAGLSLLLISGVLNWNDILNEKSAWDTIVWFSALVMMATFLGKTGVTKWFAELVQNFVTSMGLNWVAGLIIIIAIYLYSHYFFASVTAHVTAMFAAFFIATIGIGAPPMLAALLLAFSSSLMMSLTHYATGTSPIIFSSGYISLSEWWKVGFIMSVVNLTIFGTIGVLWWKILGII